MSWPRLEVFTNLMFADLRNNSELNCTAVIILERAMPELRVLSPCENLAQTTNHMRKTTLLIKLST